MTDTGEWPALPGCTYTQAEPGRPVRPAMCQTIKTWLRQARRIARSWPSALPAQPALARAGDDRAEHQLVNETMTELAQQQNRSAAVTMDAVRWTMPRRAAEAGVPAGKTGGRYWD